VGVFAPYVRNHKEAFAAANEPWSYGEEAEAIAKEYIGFRYRLLPYLYSKFYESTRIGMPVARSLCIDYPFDEKVYDKLYQYQFLCGDAILVVPVTSAEKSKRFYLPEGQWFNLYTDEPISGNRVLTEEYLIHEIPLFIKASSVIPMQSLVQTTKQNPGDTLFVHIYNGSHLKNFEYYEDDGSTIDYLEGSCYKRTITFDPGHNQVSFLPAAGSYLSGFRFIKCIFHGFENKMNEVTVNGQRLLLTREELKLVDGLRFLQDIYDPALYKNLNTMKKINPQLTIIFQNSDEEIRITW